MNTDRNPFVEHALLAVLAALLGVAVTAMARSAPDVFGIPWLGSGFLIAALLAAWKPRSWWVVGLSVPAVVVGQTLTNLGEAGPTAVSLAIAFGGLWALLCFAGAALGRGLGASLTARSPDSEGREGS